MGLFSFGNKNKQETVRDSGHFVKDDDAGFTERARSKRASHAGEGGRRGRGAADPILPEKKRARRRVVGAVALALAAAVGLPMLLDSEPKPLAGDIAINIPSKEKAAPLPVPAAPVPATSSVDSGEEIVDPAAVATPPAPQHTAPADPPPLRTLDLSKPEPAKSEPAKPDAEKPAAKLDAPKLEARKPEPEKREEKKPVKLAEAKPAEKPRADDSERALAILEGKPAEKAVEGPAPKFVVQVAALASQDKVSELQGRLRAAGISSFTQKSGELIRVRVGPYNKEEAEKVRAKLAGIGLSGTMVPL